MDLITGKETGPEMLAIVYGMEEGMRSFYETLSRRVSDEEASHLFLTLAELEVQHKERILDLYQKHGGELASVEAMGESAPAGVAEPGVSPQEMVEAWKPGEHGVEYALDFALMLETQALDLYLRYWKKSEDPATKAVLLELADQEKNHIGYLGELLEKKTGGS